jgi:hypothetical protein
MDRLSAEEIKSGEESKKTSSHNIAEVLGGGERTRELWESEEGREKMAGDKRNDIG